MEINLTSYYGFFRNVSFCSPFLHTWGKGEQKLELKAQGSRLIGM